MVKPQLILLRHAKSDWYSGALSDHDRPLNGRGMRDAPRVGRWISASAYKPEVVLCSTSLRTRQTLDGVADGAGWDLDDMDIRYLRELYHAGPREILQAAAEAFQDGYRVMVIGHNPGMEDVLLELCDHAVSWHNGKLMTTASLAVVEFSGADFSEPELLAFVRAKELN